MALNRHVVLLRAVNVGGHGALPMADLRAFAEDLGLEAPRTLLQSGNLVVGSKSGGETLERRLEHEAKTRLGRAIEFIARTAAEWAAIVAANPHAEMAKADPAHLAVIVLKADPDPAGLETLKAWNQGPEIVAASGRELYVAYPSGMGTAKLTGALIERRLGVRATARNWNTVTKLAAMLKA